MNDAITGSWLDGRDLNAEDAEMVDESLRQLRMRQQGGEASNAEAVALSAEIRKLQERRDRLAEEARKAADLAKMGITL